MKTRNILAVATAIAAILAFAWFGSAPVKAQEQSCVTPEAYFSDADTIPDFALLGAAVYNGELTDLSVMFIANGVLYLAPFNDGCLTASPIPLDGIVPPDAAPLAVPGGPLKGPKDEIGS